MKRLTYRVSRPASKLRHTCHTQVPLPVQFNCRNPQPLHGIASKSAAAQQYVNELKYFIGDGWSPVLNGTAKGQHNESWALGLTWNSNCIESAENVPECEMHFDAPFRASGGAQIRRTPAGGSVTFDKCSIFFDATFINSTTCFQVWSPVQILLILVGGNVWTASAPRVLLAQQLHH